MMRELIHHVADTGGRDSKRVSGLMKRKKGWQILEKIVTQESAEWTSFFNSQKQHRFAKLDPIYSLSEPIIDTIEKELPGFFSDDDLGFERALARASDIGFCRRYPIGRPQSLRPKSERHAQKAKSVNSDEHVSPTIGQFLKQREKDTLAKLLAHQRPVTTDQAVKSMQDFRKDLLLFRGRREAKIRLLFRQESEYSDSVELREQAFAGWLISSPSFRKEVRVLQEEWQRRCQGFAWPFVLGCWPNPFEQEFLECLPKPLVQRTREFYRRWCLDRLLSWELPEPMDFTTSKLPAGIEEAGVVLFAPWWAVREGRINVQTLVDMRRFQFAPDHLLDWLSKESASKKARIGEQRYRNLWWLYRYYELALLVRYPDQCQRNVQALDRALGILLGHGEGDEVKKRRLQLTRLMTQLHAGEGR